MNKRLLLAPLVLSALLMAACSREQAPAAPATTEPAPAAETTTAEPAVDPTTDEPAADPAAAQTQTPATAETPAPEAPAPAADPSGLVAGRDYEEIPGGQPFAPLDGKIEVVEVFNYVCPACASFQPLVNNWKTRLPADVRFGYVPAPFGRNWDPYVRAYYAAESMGIADRTHDAVFKAIHLDRKLKGERGMDSNEDIAAFYATQGVDAKQFASTMASFAVEGKFNRARQFILRGQVNSTPTMVVNGRYKMKGTSFEDMLAKTDAMIARERAAAAQTGGAD